MKVSLLHSISLITWLLLSATTSAVSQSDTQVQFDGYVDGKITVGSDTTNYTKSDWTMTWDEAGIGSISNVSFSTDLDGIAVNSVDFKFTVSDGGSFTYEWPAWPATYSNDKEFTNVKISVQYTWYDNSSNWFIEFKESGSNQLTLSFDGAISGAPDSSSGFQYAVYQAAQNQSDEYLTENASDGTAALSDSDTLYLVDFVDLMNQFTGEDYNTLFSYYEFSDSGSDYYYEITSGYLTDPEIVPEPRNTAIMMSGLMGVLVFLRHRIRRRSAAINFQ
ncbi:hypothetical protein [Cerasicoccus maritimus]|uniref:hypothetical protein n=1 Tax=Cerasicoccus maritimus TaxID=490089 RepID=UPI0028524BE9|nr:hypothetical protein [Cerasicoccus maritimus]